jgi:hypothetical protein
MSADGTNQTRLTNTLENDDSPEWSREGTQIVFRSDRERECCDPSEQVWLMNADGSNQVNLSNNTFGDYGPSLSAIVNNAPPGEIFPDAAQPATINFDNLSTGTLVTNQYSQVKFSATNFSGGSGGPQGCDVYTQSNFALGGSPPNAIFSTYNRALFDPQFVPGHCNLYLDFTVPVNDLSFSLLNVRQTTIDVTVYVNRFFYGYYTIRVNGNGSL